MDHESGVGERDRVQHLTKQCNARYDRQSMLVAIASDGNTVDPLHRQKWHAVDAHAGIVESRDPFMFERGEQIAFACEAIRGCSSWLETYMGNLQGDLPDHGRRLLRQPDARHAPCTEGMQQTIRSDHHAGCELEP